MSQNAFLIVTEKIFIFKKYLYIAFMKKLLLLILLLTLMGTAKSQEAPKLYRYKEFDYFIYQTESVVKLTDAMPEISTQVNELGYPYFSIVKKKKKSFKVGSFESMTEDTWIITVFDEEPQHDHWKIFYEGNLDLGIKIPE